MTKIEVLGQSTVNPVERKIELEYKGAEDFTFKAKGYSENFLLNLVASLKGQDVKAEVIDKPLDDAFHNVQPLVIPTSGEAQPTAPVLVEETPKLNSNSVTPKNPTIKVSEVLGEQSKTLYKNAGVTHEESDNSYYHTGIKFNEDGKPKYRCAYECPKCGETGRHYIPLNVHRVSCHKCLTPLVVEGATSKGVGETESHRDSNGNFLFAQVIDYTTKSWDKSGK